METVLYNHRKSVGNDLESLCFKANEFLVYMETSHAIKIFSLTFLLSILRILRMADIMNQGEYVRQEVRDGIGFVKGEIRICRKNSSQFWDIQDWARLSVENLFGPHMIGAFSKNR